MIASLLLLALQETPSFDGPWIRLAAPPKLERFGTGKEQTVDFTVFRSADEAWHLVSCVRQTAHPGGGRLLYRWESKTLEAPDWEPKGIFLTSDVSKGHREGMMQAPHCVVEDGVTWLFFNSGGACAVTSRDGRTWEGGGKFFDMGRDVCLFDNRARDGLWYAFFTDVRPGKYPERKDHTVAYRTAPKLAGPWSPEKPDVGVLTPPPPGYLFAFAESPFLFRRKERYYRLEQLHVYASESLVRWPSAPLAVLSGKNPLEHLSPEIVEHEGRTWLAAYRDHGRAGIWLARLAWK